MDLEEGEKWWEIVPPDPTDIVRIVLRKTGPYVWKTIKANWKLNSQMPKVERAWHKVRCELTEVGLLYEPDPNDESDDGYLDQIELEVSVLPSKGKKAGVGEAGFVCENIDWWRSLKGYKEGVIYLWSDLPTNAYIPGGTLTDVIRHEYAHTWHWLEPSFFDEAWFIDAFGGYYEDTSSIPSDDWTERILSIRKHRTALEKCRNEREENAFWRKRHKDEFVSAYASTLIMEDFAETFMTYLRHRNSLEKFKARKGVYRKLKAVEKAVARARRELGC